MTHRRVGGRFLCLLHKRGVGLIPINKHNFFPTHKDVIKIILVFNEKYSWMLRGLPITLGVFCKCFI